VKQVSFPEEPNSEEEASPLPKVSLLSHIFSISIVSYPLFQPYRTRSQGKKFKPAAIATSDSEGMMVDLPVDPEPLKKVVKGKAKAKEPAAPIAASVDELWTSSSTAHVFPESWVGEARSKSSCLLIIFSGLITIVS
jgi:hypothetical protein